MGEHRYRQTVGWTEADDKLLAELWSSGESSNGIANIMSSAQGRTFTKNSVVGRAHRLNLPLRRPPQPRSGQLVIPKDRAARGRPKIAAARDFFVAPPPAPPKAVEEAVDKSCAWEAKTLIDMDELDSHTCRWPVSVSGRWNSPADGFCGCRVKSGSSYCHEHHAIAYRPITKVDRNMGKVSSAILRY